MIEKLPFGRTGHHSTRILFGGAAFFHPTQAEVDRTFNVLLQYGINHIDTAASYGESEVWIGPWMARYRSLFFLATKTDERSAAGAAAQIERSLNRLQVDQIDLLQLHNLVDPDEWEQALGPGGVLEAAIAARDRGLVRFIGVTGHGINVARRHLASLERFAFDSVLLPYNPAMMSLPAYAADFEALYAVCRKRGVALQTIKSIARGRWGDKSHSRNTWYEPLEDSANIERAVHWALARPGVFVNSVGDTDLLPHVLAAAETFAPSLDDPKLPETALSPLFVDTDAI